MRRYFTDDVSKALEIGPLAAPILTDKSKVKFADFCSREELIARHKGNGDEFVNRIPNIDFIWSGGPLPRDLIDYAPVDLILASHLIEHVPDFIGWFQSAAKLLSPRGVISLAIPDKRQSFDYHRAPSSVGDIVEAHVTGQTRPSLRHVIDQRQYAVRYNGKNSWNEAVGAESLKKVFDAPQVVRDFISKWETSEYIDTHCWVFTPDSFVSMVAELSRLSFLSVEIIGLPIPLGSEFVVHLKVRRDA